MYVLNEYMEFGVDTPHIATYNFKLVFHLLFSTIYSKSSNVQVRFKIQCIDSSNLAKSSFAVSKTS